MRHGARRFPNVARVVRARPTETLSQQQTVELLLTDPPATTCDLRFKKKACVKPPAFGWRAFRSSNAEASPCCHSAVWACPCRPQSRACPKTVLPANLGFIPTCNVLALRPLACPSCGCNRCLKETSCLVCLAGCVYLIHDPAIRLLSCKFIFLLPFACFQPPRRFAAHGL